MTRWERIDARLSFGDQLHPVRIHQIYDKADLMSAIVCMQCFCVMANSSKWTNKHLLLKPIQHLQGEDTSKFILSDESQQSIIDIVERIIFESIVSPLYENADLDLMMHELALEKLKTDVLAYRQEAILILLNLFNNISAESVREEGNDPRASNDKDNEAKEESALSCKQVEKDGTVANTERSKFNKLVLKHAEKLLPKFESLLQKCEDQRSEEFSPRER